MPGQLVRVMANQLILIGGQPLRRTRKNFAMSDPCLTKLTHSRRRECTAAGLSSHCFCRRTPGRRRSWITTGFLLVGGAIAIQPLDVPAAESGDIVAVYSSISPAYSRTVRPDKTFQPETYAFGEGGHLGGGQQDWTIDKLGFPEIAHLVAPALASQDYLPCDPHSPRTTDLLIMVYWGTTLGTDGPSATARYQDAQSLIPPPPPPPILSSGGPGSSGGGAGQQAAAVAVTNIGILEQHVILTGIANRQRDRQSFQNAALLGYLPEMERVAAYKMTALENRGQDVIEEVEEGRYFVLLFAYDFQLLREGKGRKLLWEIRFSIPERGHDFSQQLAAMAQSASRYFGRSSNGLSRSNLPATTINFGDLKILGVEPEVNK